MAGWQMARTNANEQDPQDDAEHEDELDEEEFSLDELSQAYAEVLGRSSGQAGDAADGDEESDADEEEAEDEAPHAEEPVEDEEEEEREDADLHAEISPQSILEAMLFVGHPDNQPLAAARIAACMRGVKASEIAGFASELNAQYAADGSVYEIASDEGGYRLQLRGEFSALREKFYGRVRDARLSQPAVEVLSVVAYNQPVNRAAVDTMRGKASSSLLNQLLRRDLLQITRDESKPRDAQYNTTSRFLELFRLDSLADLPRSHDLDTQ